MSLSYKEASLDRLPDCALVLTTLRDSDKQELEDLGIDLEDSIFGTINVFEKSLIIENVDFYILYRGIQPVAIFGNNRGVVWLLATNALKASTSYSKIAKKFLKKWSHGNERLWNVASTKNTKTLKWLDRIGFDLEDLGNGMTRFVYNPKET